MSSLSCIMNKILLTIKLLLVHSLYIYNTVLMHVLILELKDKREQDFKVRMILGEVVEVEVDPEAVGDMVTVKITLATVEVALLTVQWEHVVQDLLHLVD
jgi:hypothetical protein